MKALLILLFLLTPLTGFSYDKAEGVCFSDGQESVWIIIQLYTATTAEEQTFAIKNEYDKDGELISSEKIEGEEPDYSFLKAVDENGENLFVVRYFLDTDDKPEVHQYVCHY